MNNNYIKLDENINNEFIKKECPICFENINLYSHLEFNKCKHLYHIHCLNKWKKIKNDDISDHYLCEECQKRREVDNFIILDNYKTNSKEKDNKKINKLWKCFLCHFCIKKIF